MNTVYPYKPKTMLSHILEKDVVQASAERMMGGTVVRVQVT